MTTEKPLFSPQRQRNQDNVAASVQRQQELCDLQQARVESKELHLNTLDEHNRQKAQALEDKRDAMASRGIVGNSVQSLVDTLNTSFGHDGQTEAEVFRDSVKDLTDSQQDALALRQEIADDRIELDEQKQKLNEEQARQLRSEKNAINKEQKAERKELAQLNEQKEAADADGEDTTAIDDDIAASNQKLTKLDEAKSANAAAASAHQAQSVTPASSVTEGCPNNVCHSHDLVVSCKHNGRKAEVPPSRSVGQLQVLSTTYDNTSSSGRDTITAYVGGACNKGLTTISADSSLAGVLTRNQRGSHCPYISVSCGSPSTDIVLPGTAGAPLKFHVFSPSLGWSDSFFTKPTWSVFFKHLLFTKEEDKYSKYIIEGVSCEGAGTNATVEVLARAPEKWTTEFGFAWGNPLISKSNNKGNLKSKGENQKSIETLADKLWDVNGKFAGNLDNRNFSFEGTPEFLKALLAAMSHLNYFFGIVDNQQKALPKPTKPKKNDIFSWDFTAPSVAVYAEREVKEGANSLIDTEYKFAIKVDPLIGVKAELDVLQALINLAANVVAPGAGSGAIKFIRFVEKVLAETADEEGGGTDTVNFKAKMVLTTELILAGELNCTKKFGGEPLVTATQTQNSAGSTHDSTAGAAELAAVGKIDLTGEVSASVKHTNNYFEVHAAMGAGFKVGGKGGGPSELALKMILELAENGFDFKGEWEFKGLILFFMSFATASINKKSTARGRQATLQLGAGGRGRAPAPTSQDSSGRSTENAIKEVWTIFSPFKKPFWEG